MGNFLRVCIAVILILSIFTVSVFATPTGNYDLYSFDGRTIVGSSGSGNAYIGNFTRSLAYIHSLLNNISTTIDYYLPNMNNNLHYIHVALVDAFSPGAGDSRSMWQLTAAAVSSLTAIQSAALGIAQDVYNINTNTADIDRLVGLIHSDVDQVESQLSTVNVNLQSLESINWNIDSNVRVQYSTDGVNFYDYDHQILNNTFYFKIISTSQINSLYYFTLNVAPYDTANQYNDFNLEIYANNQLIDSHYYYYNNFYFYSSLFVSPLILNNYSPPIIVKVYSNSRLQLTSSVPTARYLNINSRDYYILDEFIMNHQNNDSTNLEDIKNILIDIDNNSDFIQNNNDLEINVDIDAADGQGVTAIIRKLQDIFDFGVGLQEFLVTLNEFDNLHWFTSPETYNQVNQDPRFSPGYIDLYD